MQDIQSQQWREVYFHGVSRPLKSRKGINLVLAIILVLSLFVCYFAYSSSIQPIQLYNGQQQIPISDTTHEQDNVLLPAKQQNDKETFQTKKTQEVNPDRLSKGNLTKQANKKLINQTQKQDKIYYNESSINSSMPTHREVSNVLNFVPIYSGEIHYSRIPYQYWQHRLRMIKALGFNAIGVYVFWNHHQLERGVFDFQNEERNLVDFLKLTVKHNLKVLLRPGPYVCAQWDFGGLPARLLGIDGLKIRASNAIYEQEVYVYFTALAQVIKPFLQINNGNIILLQIQNEFGSYGQDRQHTLNLLQMWKKLGVQYAYFSWKKHFWDGASIGISEGQHLQQYTQLQQTKSFKNRLIFGGQVYTGWLTHWGQNWNGLDTNTFRSHFTGLLTNNHSFNLFLIHGGSNFGLTAGANDFHNQKYMPHITSYDYDAPINEQGRPTAKYEIIKQLMAKYSKLQPLPQPIKAISIPPVSLSLHANLFQNLPKPIPISNLTFFQSKQIQMYHQGLVIYETTLSTPKEYQLSLIVHDFALIYVDGKLQGTILRDKFQQIKKTRVNCQKQNCVLRIVVEAMGHVNYGWIQPDDRKGLLKFAVQGYNQPFKWNVYKINLNDSTVLEWKNNSKEVKGATLLRGVFDLKEIGDTFLDFQLFGKGYVWVNHHLLGRYWNIGPQHRIFCPGVWLREKENEIHVLQLIQGKSSQVRGMETLK